MSDRRTDTEEKGQRQRAEGVRSAAPQVTGGNYETHSQQAISMNGHTGHAMRCHDSDKSILTWDLPIAYGVLRSPVQELRPTAGDR
jgi:hypothetical protein